MKKENKQEYSVTYKKAEARGVVTLGLSPAVGVRPNFVSGQFITVYFPDLGLSEGKAYSVSNALHEEGFSITVKDIGAFSHRLSTMEIGNTLSASGPYGFFYSEDTDTTLVLLAGGIGVAPFKSIITDALHKNPGRKISLYYSVANHPEAIFLELLANLKEKHSNFSYMIHVTRGVAGPGCQAGRMAADTIAALHKDDLSAEYFMCGSIPFVRDMWRSLRACGIPEDRLYTEAFFA